jgi:hypothetical protein
MAEQLLDKRKHPEVLGEQRPRWQMIALSFLVVLALFFVCGGGFAALTSLSFDW